MPQRSDAQANRARIVEVARAALTEDGDASLNSIAKRAGVGPMLDLLIECFRR